MAAPLIASTLWRFESNSSPPTYVNFATCIFVVAGGRGCYVSLQGVRFVDGIKNYFSLFAFVLQILRSIHDLHILCLPPCERSQVNIDFTTIILCYNNKKGNAVDLHSYIRSLCFQIRRSVKITKGELFASTTSSFPLSTPRCSQNANLLPLGSRSFKIESKTFLRSIIRATNASQFPRRRY